MKKLLLSLVALLLCSFLLIGCSTASTTTTTPAPAATSTTNAALSTTTSATTKPVVTTPASTGSPTAAKPSSATPNPPTSSKYGGVIRYIRQVGPGTAIGLPWLMVGDTVASSQLSMQPLIREKVDGSVDPLLATSYDIDTSATPSITFHLRKGVKFSDGTDFNAQAVKWNLDQQKAPGSLNLSTASSWKSNEVIDDYTIKINLTAWQNTMMLSFSSSPSYMVSPTAYQKNGLDWMMFNIVGTGPFIQTKYQKDVSMTTARNPSYWEPGKPYPDGIQMLYVVDDLTRLALFKSGGAEILSNGRNGRLAADLEASGYQVIKVQGNGNNSLVPDSANADSPWSNIKVRQAAEYAIDKQSIATNLGFGYANALNQMNSPVLIGYDKALPGRNYDVAKAKQLLTEAGYPNGFKTAIITSPMTTDKNVVTAIQSYLTKVGIVSEMQFPQSAGFTQISNGTWHNALLFMPLQLWTNPNQTFNFFFGVPGTSFQSLKRPDGWKEMLDASKATLKQDPALILKMEDALYNDATIIPINDSTFPYIVTDKVHDHGIGIYSTHSFLDTSNIWLSK